MMYSLLLIGLLDSTMRSRRRCRASNSLTLPRSNLGGETPHSLDSLASLLALASIQPQSPAHLSLHRVPICARLSCCLLYISLFNTLLPTSCDTPYQPQHCRLLPSLSLLAIVPLHSLHTTQSAAKFCSTAYRHPHASIDGLHTLSFLHCYRTHSAHIRPDFSRHVLHHGLHHLRHHRES